MKSIEVQRSWRRVGDPSRTTSFNVSVLEVENKPPLRDQVVDLPPGLTVLCGLNGVGKTTLLRLIEATLLGDTVDPGRYRSSLLGEGHFSISVHTAGATTQLILGAGEAGVPVSLLDTFTVCGKVLEVVRQPNYLDLRNGVEPAFLDEDGLRRAAYLLGRPYDTIEIFEVEDLISGDGDSVFPLFRVSVGGVTYETENMGLGELAGLQALWMLDRVEPNSILLVEEPETFLSSLSTVAFLNLLAVEIDRKNLYAFVSTHAPEALHACPVECLRILMPHGSWAEIDISAPTNRAEVEHMLQSAVGQARLVLTEDAMAAMVVKELVGRFGGTWGTSLEIQAAGGHTIIRQLCRDLPRAETLRVVGVLDGDQQVGTAKLKWPLVKLPSEIPPDVLLRRAAESNPEGFARTIGRPIGSVQLAATRLGGLDVHDWFPEMAKALSTSTSALVNGAVECWLEEDGSDNQGRDFVTILTKSLLDS